MRHFVECHQCTAHAANQVGHEECEYRRDRDIFVRPVDKGGRGDTMVAMVLGDIQSASYRQGSFERGEIVTATEASNQPPRPDGKRQFFIKNGTGSMLVTEDDIQILPGN